MLLSKFSPVTKQIIDYGYVNLCRIRVAFVVKLLLYA